MTTHEHEALKAVVEALRGVIEASPAFRSKPIGTESSQARRVQTAQIVAEDKALEALTLADSILKTQSVQHAQIRTGLPTLDENAVGRIIAGEYNRKPTVEIPTEEATALRERLLRSEIDRECLTEAVRAAHWHLDTYGFPNHPDETLMASQKNVFNLTRPFCPPVPGRL